MKGLFRDLLSGSSKNRKAGASASASTFASGDAAALDHGQGSSSLSASGDFQRDGEAPIRSQRVFGGKTKSDGRDRSRSRSRRGKPNELRKLENVDGMSSSSSASRKTRHGRRFTLKNPLRRDKHSRRRRTSNASILDYSLEGSASTTLLDILTSSKMTAPQPQAYCPSTLSLSTTAAMSISPPSQMLSVANRADANQEDDAREVDWKLPKFMPEMSQPQTVEEEAQRLEVLESYQILEHLEMMGSSELQDGGADRGKHGQDTKPMESHNDNDDNNNDDDDDDDDIRDDHDIGGHKSRNGKANRRFEGSDKDNGDGLFVPGTPMQRALHYQEELDRMTRVASMVFDVPIALISLVDVGRQWFLSNIGTLSGNTTETSRRDAFCAHTILYKHSTVMVVPDALQDERFKDANLVVGGPKIRFYAGASLVCPMSGYKLGTLCIISPRPRPQSLSQRQQLILQEMANTIMNVLVTRRNELIRTRAINKQQTRVHHLERQLRGMPPLANAGPAHSSSTLRTSNATALPDRHGTASLSPSQQTTAAETTTTAGITTPTGSPDINFTIPNTKQPYYSEPRKAGDGTIRHNVDELRIQKSTTAATLSTSLRSRSTHDKPISMILPPPPIPPQLLATTGTSTMPSSATPPSQFQQILNESQQTLQHSKDDLQRVLHREPWALNVSDVLTITSVIHMLEWQFRQQQMILDESSLPEQISRNTSTTNSSDSSGIGETTKAYGAASTNVVGSSGLDPTNNFGADAMNHSRISKRSTNATLAGRASATTRSPHRVPDESNAAGVNSSFASQQLAMTKHAYSLASSSMHSQSSKKDMSTRQRRTIFLTQFNGKLSGSSTNLTQATDMMDLIDHLNQVLEMLPGNRAGAGMGNSSTHSHSTILSTQTSLHNPVPPKAGQQLMMRIRVDLDSTVPPLVSINDLYIFRPTLNIIGHAIFKRQQHTQKAADAEEECWQQSAHRRDSSIHADSTGMASVQSIYDSYSDLHFNGPLLEEDGDILGSDVESEPDDKIDDEIDMPLKTPEHSMSSRLKKRFSGSSHLPISNGNNSYNNGSYAAFMEPTPWYTRMNIKCSKTRLFAQTDELPISPSSHADAATDMNVECDRYLIATCVTNFHGNDTEDITDPEFDEKLVELEMERVPISSQTHAAPSSVTVIPSLSRDPSIQSVASLLADINGEVYVQYTTTNITSDAESSSSEARGPVPKRTGFVTVYQIPVSIPKEVVDSCQTEIGYTLSRMHEIWESANKFGSSNRSTHTRRQRQRANGNG